MLKDKILPTVTLTSICIVVALLLSVVNIFTTSVIENAEKEAVRKSLQEVYPDGKDFDPIEKLSEKGLSDKITEAYSADDGGYVFKMEVKGYKSGLVIMCGVSADGRVTGSKYIDSQETNGAEDKIDGKYDGQTLDTLTPEIISGSTKTSEGYRSAIEAALEGHKILKGGTAK